MSFPWTKGWQLSNDNDPAVVARTCPLVKKLAETFLNIMCLQHEGGLDFFS